MHVGFLQKRIVRSLYIYQRELYTPDKMSYAEYISQLAICSSAELNSQEKNSMLRLLELSNKNEGIHSYLWFMKQPPFGAEDIKLLSTLVERNLIREIHGNRLRKGSRSYLLTTCGLFYILSERQTLSGILLSKYSDNIILRLLLFQYLEENTIRNLSPRAGNIISEYLYRCCITSKRTIEAIKSSKILEDRDRYVKILELDLKAYAFCLGIKFTRLYRGLKHADRSNHQDEKMLAMLSDDDKFSRFRSSVQKDLDEAFEEFAKLESR